MKSGKFTLKGVNFGMFRLDGGAMFGSVPKNLWSKVITVDNENCIPLASRSLYFEVGNRKVLIDVGLGDKYSGKSKEIFAIQNTPIADLGIEREKITDVILTHLHFDHGGGISRFKEGSTSEVELVYPQANVYLQKSNFDNAKNPNSREKASYFPENVFCLENAKLTLTSGSQALFDGIAVHEVSGHTKGQQWVEINTGEHLFFFATDVIPTSRHLPLPYTMGYDICAETVMKEKEAFLKRAVSENAIVFFQHDPDTPAAYVGINERGHYSVREKVAL